MLTTYPICIRNRPKNHIRWGHQGKIVFNPDIKKQAVEVIFSVKKNNHDHPFLSFNNVPIARVTYTKHLGLIIDEKLSFSRHINPLMLDGAIWGHIY